MRAQRITQRGVAALMAVLFLLFMLGVVLVIANQMAATDVHDSAAQNSSVEALFLAESGLERATQLHGTGVACGAGLMEGSMAFGRGEFEIIAPTPFLVGALCRVRSAGRIGNVTRVIEGDISAGGFVEHFPSAADFAANWTETNNQVTGCTPPAPGYYTVYGNATGSTGGHIFAVSCIPSDNDRLRYTVERPLTTSFVATAGVPINVTFYWRKSSNDTSGTRPHLLELNILATSGQRQTLWSDNTRVNMAGWQFQTVSVVPSGAMAGRTVDRVELNFDLRENNPGGNPILYVAGGFDFINFGGGNNSVQQWREVVP